MGSVLGVAGAQPSEKMNEPKLDAHYSEEVDDRHSGCSQWILQSVVFPLLLPKMDDRRVEQMIKEDAANGPVTTPQHLKLHFDLSMLEGAACRTHVLKAKNEARVVLFYLHGGAYISNFVVPMHFDAVADIADIVSKGHVTSYLLEYPRCPSVNHKDLFDIVEAVFRRVAELHPEVPIVVAGDSTGAGMALVLAQRLVAAKKGGDDGVKQPASLVLLSPWLDVSMSAADYKPHSDLDPMLTVQGLQTCGKLLAGDGAASVPTTHSAVSPLFGSLQDLPPVSVFTSTHDLLILDAKRLRDRVKAEGSQGVFRYREKTGLLHCFFLMPAPGSRETLEEVAAIIRADCSL